MQNRRQPLPLTMTMALPAAGESSLLSVRPAPQDLLA